MRVSRITHNRTGNRKRTGRTGQHAEEDAGRTKCFRPPSYLHGCATLLHPNRSIRPPTVSASSGRCSRFSQGESQIPVSVRARHSDDARREGTARPRNLVTSNPKHPTRAPPQFLGCCPGFSCGEPQTTGRCESDSKRAAATRALNGLLVRGAAVEHVLHDGPLAVHGRAQGPSTGTTKKQNKTFFLCVLHGEDVSDDGCMRGKTKICQPINPGSAALQRPAAETVRPRA